MSSLAPSPRWRAVTWQELGGLQISLGEKLSLEEPIKRFVAGAIQYQYCQRDIKPSRLAAEYLVEEPSIESNGFSERREWTSLPPADRSTLALAVTDVDAIRSRLRSEGLSTGGLASFLMTFHATVDAIERWAGGGGPELDLEIGAGCVGVRGRRGGDAHCLPTAWQVRDDACARGRALPARRRRGGRDWGCSG